MKHTHDHEHCAACGGAINDAPINVSALNDIPVTEEITSFIHCGRCLRELPKGMSPREYASLEVGFTPLGLQVWCKRHEINVVHIDFQGRTHPANSSAILPADKS